MRRRQKLSPVRRESNSSQVPQKIRSVNKVLRAISNKSQRPHHLYSSSINSLKKLKAGARRITRFFKRNEWLQRLVFMLLCSISLVSAAHVRGVTYTPWLDVIVYCVVYSTWLTTCLPWLLLHMDGKALGLLAGVTLRLFAADIGILGWAALRGESQVLHRGLRLKAVMEPSLSWLSNAGYSLRFGVVVATAMASTAKFLIDWRLSDESNETVTTNHDQTQRRLMITTGTDSPALVASNASTQTAKKYMILRRVNARSSSQDSDVKSKAHVLNDAMDRKKTVKTWVNQEGPDIKPKQHEVVERDYLSSGEGSPRGKPLNQRVRLSPAKLPSKQSNSADRWKRNQYIPPKSPNNLTESLQQGTEKITKRVKESPNRMIESPGSMSESPDNWTRIRLDRRRKSPNTRSGKSSLRQRHSSDSCQGSPYIQARESSGNLSASPERRKRSQTAQERSPNIQNVSPDRWRQSPGSLSLDSLNGLGDSPDKLTLRKRRTVRYKLRKKLQRRPADPPDRWKGGVRPSGNVSDIGQTQNTTKPTTSSLESFQKTSLWQQQNDTGKNTGSSALKEFKSENFISVQASAEGALGSKTHRKRTSDLKGNKFESAGSERGNKLNSAIGSPRSKPTGKELSKVGQGHDKELGPQDTTQTSGAVRSRKKWTSTLTGIPVLRSYARSMMKRQLTMTKKDNLIGERRTQSARRPGKQDTPERFRT